MCENEYGWDIECNEFVGGCSADYIPEEVMAIYLEMVKQEGLV